MSHDEITRRLYAALNSHGVKSAIAAADRAGELREAIEKDRDASKTDGGLYQQCATYFDGMFTQEIPTWARSIIVVAVPVPILEVWFTLNHKKQSTIIPPTYDHSSIDTVAGVVEGELKAGGYRCIRAALPLKLLAVRSGLARYGKNNIAYVEGMGSFVRINAFYSDLPCIGDEWREPQVLEECSRCRACTDKCPTGAIDPERFQLRAERCLTFYNEFPEPFPAWIQESWHHCLIGCMRCQQYCPVNKDVKSRIDRLAEFTEPETAVILSGNAAGQMREKLAAKFGTTDLLDDPVVLARNLKSVLSLA